MRSLATPSMAGTARAGHRVVHVLIPVAVAVSGGLLGYLTLVTKNPAFCDYGVDSLPDFPLFALGAVSFFAGHVLGRLIPEERSTPTDASRAWSRLAMVSAFLVASAIFFFEALGTAEVSVGGPASAQLEPITYYVRCAIYHDKATLSGGLFTWGAIALTFFIAGHWFWGDRPRTRVEAS